MTHIYPPVLKIEKEENLVKKFMHRIDNFKPTVDSKEVDFYQWMKDNHNLYESTVNANQKIKNNKSKDKEEKADWAGYEDD